VESVSVGLAGREGGREKVREGGMEGRREGWREEGRQHRQKIAEISGYLHIFV